MNDWTTRSTWATTFRQALAGIDPNIKALAKDFTWDQMDEACGVAGALWHGHHPFLHPETIKEAIELAIMRVTIEIAECRRVPHQSIH